MLLFLILCLAAFRITWFITDDQITSGFRDAVDGFNDSLGYLVSCRWCMGFYVSGVITLLAWLYVDTLPLPLLWWPAISGAVGVIGGLAYKLEDEPEEVE